MFVIQNIILGIASVLHIVISIYTFVVIASALISWVNPDPYNVIVRTLRQLTEPAFYFVRKYLPFTYISGLDLSPIVVLLALQLFDSIVVTSLIQFARML